MLSQRLSTSVLAKLVYAIVISVLCVCTFFYDICGGANRYNLGYARLHFIYTELYILSFSQKIYVSLTELLGYISSESYIKLLMFTVI